MEKNLLDITSKEVLNYNGIMIGSLLTAKIIEARGLKS